MNAFISFEKYVSKQIKIFHLDGEEEFSNSKLSSHFLFTWIVHKVSYPYTLEKTSMVKS